MKQSANWIMGDIAAHLKNIKMTITEAKLTPASLAELISLIKDGTISGKIAKEVPPVTMPLGFTYVFVIMSFSKLLNACLTQLEFILIILLDTDFTRTD